MTILEKAQKEAEKKTLAGLKGMKRVCFLGGHKIGWAAGKRGAIGYCKVCNKHFYEKY